MRLLRPKPIPCIEVVEIVTDYLEGTMPARDRRRFEAHLAACEHCTEYLAQIRATIEVSGRLPPDALSDAALAALRDVCAAWADGG
jgi:anti-sigma factor RsiW